MKPSAKLNVPENVMSRQLGEECVMLDLESGTYFGLDPVGARVWQLLNDGKSIDEACEILALEYDASRDLIDSDVSRLVKELAAHGLVVPA